jgi:hypothetical protein
MVRKNSGLMAGGKAGKLREVLLTLFFAPESGRKGKVGGTAVL